MEEPLAVTTAIDRVRRCFDGLDIASTHALP